MQMDGEQANVGEPPRHPAWIGACRRRCPGKGGFDGQMLFATILDEREELIEKLLGPGKPVAEGASRFSPTRF